MPSSSGSSSPRSRHCRPGESGAAVEEERAEAGVREARAVSMPPPYYSTGLLHQLHRAAVDLREVLRTAAREASTQRARRSAPQYEALREREEQGGGHGARVDGQDAEPVQHNTWYVGRSGCVEGRGTKGSERLIVLI